MKQKNILIGFGILIAVLVASYFYFGGSLPFQTQDEVVARVNGEEVVRSELDARIAQFEQALTAQGQSSQLENEESKAQLENQALSQIIAEKLVLQEAEKENINVSQEEVDTEYQNIVTTVGGEEALSQRLEELDTTKEDLRENIEQQLITQKYIDNITANENFEVTDEEVVAFYDEWSAEQEDPPAFEEVETQVRDQLVSQKENQFISDFIAELRQNANIEILL